MKPFLLDGRWEKSSLSCAVANPWNGEKIAEVSIGDPASIGRAAAAAHKAFATTRRLPASERSAQLLRIADAIRRRRMDFVNLLIAEAGKPLQLAEAEVARAETTFAHAAHEAVMPQGEMLEMEATAPGRGHLGMVKRFPLGVILGITPFNFPLNLVAHKVAPCIATGNTMVLKPALKTPLTALLLAEVLLEAELPAGQINVVPFSHEHVGPLLGQGQVQMLSFTGSAGVGWKLKTEAARLRVALELGGNAALVVDENSDWAPALPKIAAGLFGYAGQSCISIQRIFSHRSIDPQFRDDLTAWTLENVKSGDPADPATLVGPMISASARDKVVKWIEEAQARGARLLTPLKRSGLSVLDPVLLEGVPRDCAVVCEEAFAPLGVLDSFDSFEEALAKVNDSVFGLQAGVFTRDLGRAMRAFESIEAGGILINQVPTFRVENMPYGGVKDSGFGREGVRYAMEEMTEPRSLILNPG